MNKYYNIMGTVLQPGNSQEAENEETLSGKISEASCLSTVAEMDRSFPETGRRLFQEQITAWPKAEEQGGSTKRGLAGAQRAQVHTASHRWPDGVERPGCASQKGERVENLVHRVSQPNVSAPTDTALRKDKQKAAFPRQEGNPRLPSEAPFGREEEVRLGSAG